MLESTHAVAWGIVETKEEMMAVDFRRDSFRVLAIILGEQTCGSTHRLRRKTSNLFKFLFLSNWVTIGYVTQEF